MSADSNELFELHWLFDMLHNIDAGLIVLDVDYNIQLWNSFMENHSGVSSANAKEHSLFDVFPHLNSNWLRKKMDTVVALHTPIHLSWEQRPYLFLFKSYRPITGVAEQMFQNVTIRPLTHIDGTVKHICIIVYDVTDVATNKTALSTANRTIQVMKTTDHLTGLKNRSSIEKALGFTLQAFQKSPKSSHALIMIRPDYFRDEESQYDYLISDVVTQAISQVLLSSVKPNAFVGRFNSEKFAIVLPNNNAKNAADLLDTLRKEIESLLIETKNGNVSTTLSIGVAQADRSIDSISDWVSKADEALGKAELAGGNQIVSA
ncbi:diguanylate cyclase domain-containing protein [Marinomonas sp. 2405UD68-3]|uniref:sensor domain-containing diguanylate cyclase n=1 Tax=Marinomonas sp. 2405UD68-3 TaxID=3391835 RepID=UPI0039C95CBC